MFAGSPKGLPINPARMPDVSVFSKTTDGFPMRIRPASLAAGLLLASVGCQSPWLSSGLNPFRKDEPAVQTAIPKPARSPQNLAGTQPPTVAKPEAPTGSLHAADQQRLQDFLARGNRALSDGQFELAKIEYESALGIDAASVSAHHMLGRVGDQTRNFDYAEYHYLQALSGAPNNADLLTDLGYSLFQQGRLPEAKNYLQQAITLQPNHRMAAVNMAAVTFWSGDRNGAVAWLRKVGSSEDQVQQTLAMIAQKPPEKSLPTGTTRLAGFNETDIGAPNLSFDQIQQQMNLAREQSIRERASRDRAEKLAQQELQHYRDQYLNRQAASGFADDQLNNQMRQIDQDHRQSRQAQSGFAQPDLVPPSREGGSPPQWNPAGQMAPQPPATHQSWATNPAGVPGAHPLSPVPGFGSGTSTANAWNTAPGPLFQDQALGGPAQPLQPPAFHGAAPVGQPLPAWQPQSGVSPGQGTPAAPHFMNQRQPDGYGPSSGSWQSQGVIHSDGTAPAFNKQNWAAPPGAAPIQPMRYEELPPPGQAPAGYGSSADTVRQSMQLGLSSGPGSLFQWQDSTQPAAYPSNAGEWSSQAYPASSVPAAMPAQQAWPAGQEAGSPTRAGIWVPGQPGTASQPALPPPAVPPSTDFRSAAPTQPAIDNQNPDRWRVMPSAAGSARSPSTGLVPSPTWDYQSNQSRNAPAMYSQPAALNSAWQTGGAMSSPTLQSGFAQPAFHQDASQTAPHLLNQPRQYTAGPEQPGVTNRFTNAPPGMNPMLQGAGQPGR